MRGSLFFTGALHAGALHSGALHSGALPPPKFLRPCGADWTDWVYGGRTRGYAPTTYWTNWTY